jgi:hypothetical protein
MKKKSEGSGPVVKKSVRRKRSTPKKKIDAAKVREDLAGMVKSGAKGIAQAVIDQAMQGELAPAKYLLEMAGVFPTINEGDHATEEEDCLAKTLLDRLNIPRKPVQEKEGEGGEENGVGNKVDAGAPGHDGTVSNCSQNGEAS